MTARVSVAMQFKKDGVVVGTPGGGAQAYFVIYGYGFSDCSTADDIASCQGEASVAIPFADFFALSNPPSVPYTAKSFFDPNGGLTIVAAPNGGGVGVPVSTWLNAKDGGLDLSPGAGNWKTCEFDEWYEDEFLPDFALCENQDTNGDGLVEQSKPSCGCTDDEALTDPDKGATQPALDILVDPNFPGSTPDIPDLFSTFFGPERIDYADIKESVRNIGDCSTANLNENSAGPYWVTGDCDIQANRQIGQYDTPVVLIGEQDITINGATLFGLVYCTDAPEVAADGEINPFDEEGTNGVQLSGNGVVYGAIVVDCGTFNVNGTFDLVYNAEVIANANTSGGLGAVSAGWRDYDVPPFPAN
jgi:hypothetical protein